jgi:hypothetical protein
MGATRISNQPHVVSTLNAAQITTSETTLHRQVVCVSLEIRRQHRDWHEQHEQDVRGVNRG